MQLFKYNAGGKIGNISFVWKIPEGEIEQASQHKTVQCIAKVVPEYETRAAAREMRERYLNRSGLSPVIRRNLVQYLTGKIPQ